VTSVLTILLIFFSDLKGVPRTEATQIVGSLLAFPPILHNIPLLLPNPNELSLISSADVKDQIVGVLLKSGKKEPAGKIFIFKKIWRYTTYVHCFAD
jgi:hypothetical protein